MPVLCHYTTLTHGDEHDGVDFGALGVGVGAVYGVGVDDVNGVGVGVVNGVGGGHPLE